MSNLTFDEGLIREHPPEPLEGHTVVVLERVGEAGERFHSLLESGDERPWQIALAALLRRPNPYIAFAVDTRRDYQLAFVEPMDLRGATHGFALQFSLWYRVADPQRLVGARARDPLRQVRNRVAEVLTSVVGALDGSAGVHVLQAVIESLVSGARAELLAFAAEYGIEINELRAGIPDDIAEAYRMQAAETERLKRELVETIRNLLDQQADQTGIPVDPGDLVQVSRILRGDEDAVLYRLDMLASRLENLVEGMKPQAALPGPSRGEDAAASPPVSLPSSMPPEAPPEASPEAPPPAEDGDVLYRVWYATNRRPVGTGATLSYSGRVDERVHLGSCDVVIPATHRMGELGSPWIRRFLTRTDDRLRLQAITPLEAEHFWSGVRDVAASYPADKRHALVFIHGYRVSFKGAALRAAQLGYDLGVKGPVAFFSWPSRATVFGYPADGSAVEASEGDITDFLIQFARDCGADRVHIIAHSMGNRPLLRALQRILSAAEAVPAVRFGHLILAAPDVTRGLFLDVADQYRRLAQRTTLYVSDEDNALRVSFRMQGDRVGLAPPVTCAEGIDTIHVGKVDRTMLGHSTFAEARPVLNDIHALLSYDAPPDQRAGLDERMQGNERYWEFRA